MRQSRGTSTTKTSQVSTSTTVSSASTSLSSLTSSSQSSSTSLLTSSSSSTTQPSTTTSNSVSNTSSSSSTSSTSTSSAPSTLVMDDWTWPTDDLNQLYAVYELPWPNWLQYDMYQPLVTVNASAQFGTGAIEFVPALAQNWTVSADSTTYTFNLQNNVTFSDGNPFNAYQVWFEMYAFYYLSGNASSWLESYSLFNMSNVTFGPATIALINSSGGLVNPTGQALAMMQNSSWPIYVTSPHQIVFHMQTPFLYLLDTLVSYEGLIFDGQWALQHGGIGNASGFNSYFNQNPIPATGPYSVTKVSEDNYVEFSQNPTYWGASLSASQLAVDPYLSPGNVKTVVVYCTSRTTFPVTQTFQQELRRSRRF